MSLSDIWTWNYPSAPLIRSCPLEFLTNPIYLLVFGLPYFCACYFIPKYVMSPKTKSYLDANVSDFASQTLDTFNGIRGFTQIFIAYKLCQHAIVGRFNIFCQGIQTGNIEQDIEICYTLRVFLLLKYIDFLDAIPILTSKYYVHSTLIYHHLTLAIAAWVIVRFAPGGSSVFPVMINCFCLAALIFYRFYVSLATGLTVSKGAFRKALCIMQATQFTLIGVLSFVGLFHNTCTYPKEIFVATLLYLLSICASVAYFRDLNICTNLQQIICSGTDF